MKHSITGFAALVLLALRGLAGCALENADLNASALDKALPAPSSVPVPAPPGTSEPATTDASSPPATDADAGTAQTSDAQTSDAQPQPWLTFAPDPSVSTILVPATFDCVTTPYPDPKPASGNLPLTFSFTANVEIYKRGAGPLYVGAAYCAHVILEAPWERNGNMRLATGNVFGGSDLVTYPEATVRGPNLEVVTKAVAMSTGPNAGTFTVEQLDATRYRFHGHSEWGYKFGSDGGLPVMRSVQSVRCESR